MAHRTAAFRTTAILLLAIGVPARSEELIGLDQGGQGRIETLQRAAHSGWARIPALSSYRETNGATRPAQGDVDGDGRLEVVVGIDGGPSAGGYVAVLDDAEAGHRLIRWLRLPDAAYDAAGGQTWPSCGDIDGDGRDEVVVGQGPWPANGGRWFAYDDSIAGFALIGSARVPLDAYNQAWGETRPACGDFDGDGRDEVAIGLGPTPSAGGRVAIFSGLVFQRWARVPWAAYDSARGETWPAAGDVDGDGRDELLLGLGPFPPSGGWLVLLDDARSGFATLGWRRLPWSAYDAGNGETRPGCADVDGDGLAEVLVGLGQMPGNGGWFAEFGDGAEGLPFRRWRRVPWAAYSATGRGTRPATARAAGRDPAVWPFSVGSPWNTPIGSLARYEDETSPNVDPSDGGYLNVTEWTHPVFIASASDPVRTFFSPDGSVLGQARVPAEARPDPEEDAHMHVIDEMHRSVVETWQCSRRPDGDFNVVAFAVNDLTDAGVYDDWHGTRAYGGSAIAGLIRRGELTHGIRHVLAMAMLNTALNRNTPNGLAYVWPASSADGGDGSMYGTTGNLHMGTLMAIPPSVNLDSLVLSPAGRSIARALQDYGAYIVDIGSNLTFYAEPGAGAEVTQDLYDDVNALMGLLRVVANNTPATPGGGGTPRRGPAPPFAR